MERKLNFVAQKVGVRTQPDNECNTLNLVG